MSKENKTHWLQNPNKNYLGHWDLPNGNDIILTIKSAQWEEVKNPIINISDAKRVIRFVEDVKPFICNQTNAQTILKATKQSFMEDCLNMKIVLTIGMTKVKGENVDCLRVKNIPQDQLQEKSITEKQKEELENLLEQAKKDKIEFCKVMRIRSLHKLPESKYIKVVKRLNEIINSENESENN